MKKILAIILAALMLFSLAACGNKTTDGNASNGNTSDVDTSEGVVAGDENPAEITIGTGGPTGTYFGFCNTIATILNEKMDVKLTAMSSGASKANILDIDDGIVQMAIVQNDVMDYAYNGTSLFEADGAIKSFSTLGGVYAEICQVIARADSGIQSLADLKGKRVSVGDSGSGVEFNAQQMLGAYDITFDDIKKQNLSFQASADALKDNKIDAFFCTAGAPTVAITDLATSTGIVIVEIDDEHIKALQEDYAFYTEYVIPAGTYNGFDKDAKTVCVKATFIVSNSLSEDAVYALTKAIYENKDEYTHDKAKEMSLEYAVSGISVPFHPGAERYFKEVGAIK